MESITYLKNIKISPKKLRFFIPQIKKLLPIEALSKLLYVPKKPARVFYKAIKSAVSNAKQTLKVNEDLLEFKLLSVDEGHVLKRYNPGSRGSAMPYKKRFSHIKIVLQAKSVSQPVVEKKVENKIEKKEQETKQATEKKITEKPKEKVTKTLKAKTVKKVTSKK